MKVLMLANGPIYDYEALRPALDGCGCVIACDGGLRHAAALGLTPDYVVGDMDSAPPALLSELPAETKCVTYPAEKDETDLELGFSLALRQEPEAIAVLGGLNGRLDHTLANIHAMAAALTAGVSVTLWDETTRVWVTGHTCTLRRAGFETVSLIPLTSEVTGIVTEGLYYPLRGETLAVGTTRGVSNRFTQEEASVTITSGLLLVIATKKET